MKKGFLISWCLLVLLTLTSCDDGESGGEKVLGEEKMAAVITDIMINERIVASRMLSLDSALEVYHGTYVPWLYEKHGLTKEMLDKSMSYYLENTAKLNDIMRVVNDTLSARYHSGRFR